MAGYVIFVYIAALGPFTALCLVGLAAVLRADRKDIPEVMRAVAGLSKGARASRMRISARQRSRSIAGRPPASGQRGR